jgi:L-histidine Nalpha-methyltransferase
MTPATSSTAAYTIDRLSEARPWRDQLADDVREGLTRTPKLLPPKYFYDERGSELFEAITELPEYYPTRTETAILEAHAATLIARTRPAELVELGSGSSRKTRLLLEAMHATGTGDRYAPLEISEAALVGAAQALTDDYPWLEVHGHLGDFDRDLGRLPRAGRRLVAFLGSTIGNLLPPERHRLFRAVADALGPDDAFLLGADLVKSPDVLVPAYDDAAGVTAEFNRNMLRVLNRELDADLPVETFEHRAVWNHVDERIEMHLVARAGVHARFGALDLDVRFEPGEPLVTEYSCKFRVDRLTRELAGAGMQVVEPLTDDARRFAVLLAVPTRA